MKRQETLDKPSLLGRLRAWLLLLLTACAWVFLSEKLYRRRKWQVGALVLLILVTWSCFARQVA